MGVLVLSLTAEQAIVYKGIKKAKDICNEIKLRFEGAVKDRKIDLMLELTSLKKSHSESIDEYLTRAQGLCRQMNELGKTITERELVRYIIEGLPDTFESIVLPLSTNRAIPLVDLRQTLLNFEKRNAERRDEFKAYKTGDRHKAKSYYVCNKPGHLQKDC
ncbi:hypothetical protein AVEN_172643-1 [Araneus ventricosus]|uniref:CCHC-type domain-containing protein n=1 Tax=Araneus ventricosus TaxID=182803 RepID=A0A4Y2NGH6_ARAVE|nr:hypothetical protein AVEN_172643-1 [Araneus ventricosus]